MGRKYLIKEIFHTLQGEGFWTGRPACFVRFAGCNLWSGLERDRARDSRRAPCAEWCDTDFAGGAKMSAEEILEGVGRADMVVFTGGEPLLQLDQSLVSALGGRYLALETNGTTPLGVAGLDWVACAPKCLDRMELARADEVKVMWPDLDPIEVRGRLGADFASHWWISPVSRVGGIGDRDVFTRAASLCRTLPGFRLTLQAHKVWGIR